MHKEVKVKIEQIRERVTEIVTRMLNNDDLNDVKDYVIIDKKKGYKLEFICYRSEEPAYFIDENGEQVEEDSFVGRVHTFEAYLLINGVPEESFTPRYLDENECINGIMEIVGWYL